MFLNDFTIPEAEVIYQKAVIRGAWWFLAFLAACVVVYIIVRKIMQDRQDARFYALQLERIKASNEIGRTGFWAARASQTTVILEQKKQIQELYGIISYQRDHIERLEKTLNDLHFGDVAERIRKEIEDGKNESEDRR